MKITSFLNPVTGTIIVGLISAASIVASSKISASADQSERVSDLSERIARLEAVNPEINRRLESIEGSVQTISSMVNSILLQQKKQND